MAACPHCRSVLDDAPELAGQFVLCPRCGKQFPMPPVDVPVIRTTPTIQMRSPIRHAKRADKAPRLVLLIATICWPVLAIAASMVRQSQMSKWGQIAASAAGYQAASTVTGLYFTVVLICLAWWFYAKD